MVECEYDLVVNDDGVTSGGWRFSLSVDMVFVGELCQFGWLMDCCLSILFFWRCNSFFLSDQYSDLRNDHKHFVSYDSKGEERKRTCHSSLRRSVKYFSSK